jgi:hypothetical protein
MIYIDPFGLAEYGMLPGTNIRYRIDWNQQPEPNMHVYWRDGTESVISARGGWLRTHGGKVLEKPPKAYRAALRQVTEKFTKKTCMSTPKLKGIGILGAILQYVDIFEALEESFETGIDPSTIYLKNMGVIIIDPES